MNTKIVRRVAAPRLQRTPGLVARGRRPRKAGETTSHEVAATTAVVATPEDVAAVAPVADDAPVAIAELEAVAGAEDGDEEPAAEREAQEPSNFLAMYFKEMARLAVLQPQEEFEHARQLEALEIALWV